MKNTFSFVALISVLAISALAFTGAIESFKVDTKSSYIDWKGYKVTGKHYGKVMLKNGDLKFENGKLVGGSFEIDMSTIICEDLQGAMADKLVGHLKSDDFFGVAKYPTAKFVITRASEGNAGEYRIRGDLTIKSTTKSISFNATVNEKDGKRIAKADIKIDRSDFDVRYGSGSFFDNLGDKTIYDEFDLSVNLVVAK